LSLLWEIKKKKKEKMPKKKEKEKSFVASFNHEWCVDQILSALPDRINLPLFNRELNVSSRLAFLPLCLLERSWLGFSQAFQPANMFEGISSVQIYVIKYYYEIKY